VHFSEMQAKARAVRAQYADMEVALYGRAWTREEIMLGFLGDVGDLAQARPGQGGGAPTRRPRLRPRPRAGGLPVVRHHSYRAARHRRSLADAYDVDLEAAFDSTMSSLRESLENTSDRP
jgi:hypothetical protein